MARFLFTRVSPRYESCRAQLICEAQSETSKACNVWERPAEISLCQSAKHQLCGLQTEGSPVRVD